MKIALIGQKGIPVNRGGGVERHVENLAISLANLGHEVYVYTRRNYTDRHLVNYQGVHLISLPSLSSKNLDAISHTFLACLDLIFKRKVKQVDVIHFHSIGPSSLIWLIKLFKPKTPIVATFHSQCYFNSKWGFLAKTYLKFGEWMITKADKLITVSKALSVYVKNKYPQARPEYIPNGVNMPSILEASEITQNWGLTKNNYILNVGRLVSNKGVEYLISAYQNLATDKKLVIVGDGSMETELKELAKNNANIIFVGNQSGQVLAELYSNAYLFIQPSEAEGLSLALLEAMSYKLACLVSDIPANSEVVGARGLTFKNKDISDLQNKLQDLLLNNNKIVDNQELMLAKVQADYNWPTIVDRIVGLYQELTNN